MKKILFFLVYIFLPLIGSYGLNVQIELQFYKDSYRLNEPIPVTINVMNNSSEPVKFNISPLIYETFFFSIITPKNEEVSLLDSFQVEMKNNQSSSGEYRMVWLMPHESFSRKIDVTRWFDIREAGYYYIKGIFYPNPDNKKEWSESFNYKILVKPPIAVDVEISVEEETRKRELEQVQKLPPYEVIEDMLDAKMKKDWKRFLIHIDAERLVKAFTDYYKAYENARTGSYKLEVIEDFKKYLTTYWQDRILSYKVLEAQIKEDKATVICDVEYKVRTITYILRYNFSLYKNHLGQWLLYDYYAHKVL